MNVKEYMVDISTIVVDHSFQRSLNWKWVKQIANNYDDLKVNQLILSAHPDGTYVVIDGQHTIEATRLAKGEHAKLSAKVFFGATIEDEAKLFYSYNSDRKPLKTADRIKARYAANDPVVVEYFDSLTSVGINWTLTSGGSGNGKTLRNHASTLRTFTIIGKYAAIPALTIAKKTNHLDPNVLSAIMWFLSVFPNINMGRLARKLETISDAEIRQTAYSISNVIGYSASSVASSGFSSKTKPASTTRAYARVIAYFYNKGLHKDSYLDLFEL